MRQPLLSDSTVPGRGGDRSLLRVNQSKPLQRRIPGSRFYSWLLYANLSYVLLICLAGFIFASAVFGALLFELPGTLRREGESVDDILGSWLVAVAVLVNVDVGAGVSGAKLAAFVGAGAFQLISLIAVVGIVFKRLAAPRARVQFSRVPTFAMHNGRVALTFSIECSGDCAIHDAELCAVLLPRE